MCYQPGPASKGKIASAPLRMVCFLLCSGFVVVCFFKQIILPGVEMKSFSCKYELSFRVPVAAGIVRCGGAAKQR